MQFLAYHLVTSGAPLFENHNCKLFERVDF